jgi:hypothetical protein
MWRVWHRLDRITAKKPAKCLILYRYAKDLRSNSLTGFFMLLSQVDVPTAFRRRPHHVVIVDSLLRIKLNRSGMRLSSEMITERRRGVRGDVDAHHTLEWLVLCGERQALPWSGP